MVECTPESSSSEKFSESFVDLEFTDEKVEKLKSQVEFFKLQPNMLKVKKQMR